MNELIPVVLIVLMIIVGVIAPSVMFFRFKRHIERPTQEEVQLDNRSSDNESRKLIVKRHDISCAQLKQLVDKHGQIKDSELDNYIIWSHVRKDLLRLMARAEGYKYNKDLKVAHDKLFRDDKNAT